jgi:hypothetical protein
MWLVESRSLLARPSQWAKDNDLQNVYMGALFGSFGTKSLSRGRKFVHDIYENPNFPWEDKFFFLNLYKLHNLYSLTDFYLMLTTQHLLYFKNGNPNTPLNDQLFFLSLYKLHNLYILTPKSPQWQMHHLPLSVMQLWICFWSWFFENFSGGGGMNKVHGKKKFTQNGLSIQKLWQETCFFAKNE